MVRLTASRGYVGSSSSALGVPVAGELVVGLVDHHDPGGGLTDRPSVSGPTAVPVGLFGLAINTTSGATRDRRHGPSTSMREVVAAGKVRPRLWVLRAYSGYIE